jgi:flagellar hook-associated protein 1 FlgK
MSSLFGILSAAGQSLLTFQRGINSTKKNIANVSTEGCNREIPVFQDLPRSGIFIGKHGSLKSRIYDARIQRACVSS